MPTVEFRGYSSQAEQELYTRLRQCYADLDFRDDIVFVLGESPRSRVLAFSGDERPFVRLHSRSAERLQALVARSLPHCDVETVRIGFHERRPD